MQLTTQQVEDFHNHGVIVACGILTDADLQPVIDELSAWIDDRAQTLHAEGKIAELHEDAPFEQRYGLLFGQCQDIGQGMDIMFYRGQAMFHFLHNARLLDAVEGLVGPEITCNPIQHLRAKPPVAFDPHTGPSFHVVPWHQDAGVMMPEAEGSNVVTCWLPLGDATEEMGCMQALPDVFRNGYLRHLRAGGTTIDPALMPDAEPISLACRKGDVVFMHRLTPHRSTPNVSDQCRWSLDLRYQTTGHHTGRTAHPDFVVRSRQAPSSVMDSYPKWRTDWIDAFENPHGVVGHRAE